MKNHGPPTVTIKGRKVTLKAPSGRAIEAGDLKAGKTVRFNPFTGRQLPPDTPRRKK